jgi:uncharacterized integral membrane protein
MTNHGQDHRADPRETGEAPQVEQTGTGVSRWSLLLLVLAIVLVVILGQNTEPVTVELLWTTLEAPLFLVVLLAALGLTVLWELGTLVLRHQRRRAERA